MLLEAGLTVSTVSTVSTRERRSGQAITFSRPKDRQGLDWVSVRRLLRMEMNAGEL